MTYTYDIINNSYFLSILVIFIKLIIMKSRSLFLLINTILDKHHRFTFISSLLFSLPIIIIIFVSIFLFNSYIRFIIVILLLILSCFSLISLCSWCVSWPSMCIFHLIITWKTFSINWWCNKSIFLLTLFSIKNNYICFLFFRFIFFKFSFIFSSKWSWNQHINN